MKKLLLLLLLLSGLATAQTIQVSGNASSQSVPPAYVTPDCTISGSFTATGNSTTLPNSDTGCSTWNFVYSNSGFSVVSVEVDFASESATLGVPGSFSVWPGAQIGNGTLPLTAITEAGVTLSGYHPYVRIKANTLTGSGTLKYKLYGWKGQGSSDVVQSSTQVQGTAANGAAPVGNPVLVAGSDGVNQHTVTTDTAGNLYSVPFPSALTSNGIVPVVSTAAEGSHVLKASAGNLYGVCVTTGASAGFLMVFNATSAPADGAVTPTEWIQLGANSTSCISYGSGPPNAYATGITAVFSTTGPFTKTISATAAFVGRVK